jgi:hypothetical protein
MAPALDAKTTPALIQELFLHGVWEGSSKEPELEPLQSPPKQPLTLIT